MANTLKGWMADLTVTADPNDKMLVLESTGKADMDKVHEEMRAEDTGLRLETIVHVTSLYHRTVAKLLMNGYSVNTGLFYAVPRFTGTVEGGRWNPEKNSIYVSFTQDKVIREEIAQTTVKILGLKRDVMYILETEDRRTGLKDGTMTPGHNLFIRGGALAIAGTHADVGITLTNLSTQAMVKLEEDRITRNKPSELTLLIPAGLPDGEYELSICTQYSNSKTFLKEPRKVVVNVHVGASTPGGDGEEGGGDDVLE